MSTVKNSSAMDMRHLSVGDSSMSFEEQWSKLAEIARTRREYIFPADYLVLDIETDGLSSTKNNILQVGYLLCLGGQICNSGAVFVETPVAELDAYNASDYVQKQVASGNSGYVKAADVRALGQPRKEVFETVQKLVAATMAIEDAVVVGHNLCRFDVPFIEYFSSRVGCPVVFDKSRVIDTGALTKANQLGAIPAVGEPRWDFFSRVCSYVVRGVFWRLEVAAERFGVIEKLPFDIAATHDAGSDCVITHYIYEQFRTRLAEYA